MVDPLRFRNDAPRDEPAVTLEALACGSNAAAVRIEPAQDARALIPYLGQLALIEIGFPTFRDGRGYSSARILREAGYTGELRAQGDVLVDQLTELRRCGFDSFAPNTPLDQAAVTRTLVRWADVYQKAADGRQPVWALRHG